jgi:hypothetical protein
VGAVDFPWRLGIVQGLLAALLVGIALSPEPSKRLPRRWAIVMLAVAALPALVVSGSMVEVRDYEYDLRIAHHPQLQSRVVREYLPRTVERHQLLHALPYPVANRAGLLGAGDVRVARWTSHERNISVKTPEPTSLWIHTFAYPGWTATIGDRELEINHKATNGVMLVAIPKGQHDVLFRFGGTRWRRVGAWLSALTGIGILASWIRWKNYPRPIGPLSHSAEPSGDRAAAENVETAGA